MFWNEFFWRSEYSRTPIKIQSVWPELPVNMSPVNAVYEADDLRVWFVVGNEIFIYEGDKLVQRFHLKDFGILPKHNNEWPSLFPYAYPKIEMMFKWPCNNQTYLGNRRQMWHLNGTRAERVDVFLSTQIIFRRRVVRATYSPRPEINPNEKVDHIIVYGGKIHRLQGIIYEQWCPYDDSRTIPCKHSSYTYALESDAFPCEPIEVKDSFDDSYYQEGLPKWLLPKKPDRTGSY